MPDLESLFSRHEKAALAASGQPLATETEIRVWYGHPLSVRQRN